MGVDIFEHTETPHKSQSENEPNPPMSYNFRPRSAASLEQGEEVRRGLEVVPIGAQPLPESESGRENVLVNVVAQLLGQTLKEQARALVIHGGVCGKMVETNG